MKVAKEVLDDMIEANKGYWPELIQLIVLADEGLAFISQFWSECHRESLPINSSSVQYNTSVVQDASFCTRKRQAFCTQWHACVQKKICNFRHSGRKQGL